MVLSWLRLVFLLQHMFHLRRKKMNLFEWIYKPGTTAHNDNGNMARRQTKEANGATPARIKKDRTT